MEQYGFQDVARAQANVEALGADPVLGARVGELEALPGIGEGIAAGLEELLRTGRWSTLEHLRGELEPERLFRAVPGVGRQLARRFQRTLEAECLEQGAGLRRAG
jgi:DNA polymerase/3'-5' exonuclease PolX